MHSPLCSHAEWGLLPIPSHLGVLISTWLCCCWNRDHRAHITATASHVVTSTHEGKTTGNISIVVNTRKARVIF